MCEHGTRQTTQTNRGRPDGGIRIRPARHNRRFRTRDLGPLAKSGRRLETTSLRWRVNPADFHRVDLARQRDHAQGESRWLAVGPGLAQSLARPPLPDSSLESPA